MIVPPPSTVSRAAKSANASSFGMAIAGLGAWLLWGPGYGLLVSGALLAVIAGIDAIAQGCFADEEKRDA